MGEYLSTREMKDRASEIREELLALFKNKAVIGRAKANQWRFLAACLERGLSPAEPSEFDGMPSPRAAQYKFEAEDRLKRFYLRPGRAVKFVFALVHKTKLAESGITDAEDYHDLGGYCVLVRDISSGYVESIPPTHRDIKAYLERVVSEAIDAEFLAYKALPEVRTDGLSRWFIEDGPAWREVANILSRHQEKGWTLSNPLNPSTKRLMHLQVKKIAWEEAVVYSTEYWYLRWWNTKTNSYAYPYRETNRQVYILRNDGGEWKVFENLRPSPRTSAPHRRLRLR